MAAPRLENMSEIEGGSEYHLSPLNMTTLGNLGEGGEGLIANRSLPIKQAELTRLLKGVVGAGVEIGRIEVDPRTGHVVIIHHKATEKAMNPWDEE